MEIRVGYHDGEARIERCFAPLCSDVALLAGKPRRRSPFEGEESLELRRLLAEAARKDGDRPLGREAGAQRRTPGEPEAPGQELERLRGEAARREAIRQCAVDEAGRLRAELERLREMKALHDESYRELGLQLKGAHETIAEREEVLNRIREAAGVETWGAVAYAIHEGRIRTGTLEGRIGQALELLGQGEAAGSRWLERAEEILSGAREGGEAEA